MKELFFLFLVVCLGIWLALVGQPEGEPDNFQRICDRYDRIIIGWIIMAAAGWIYAGLCVWRVL